MSIRGARFTRNSIDKKKPNSEYLAGCSVKTGAVLIQRRIPPSSISLEHPQGNQLRNKKNFIRVRILYFRSRRESFDIDILAR
jgi:hypothetical protein